MKTLKEFLSELTPEELEKHKDLIKETEESKIEIAGIEERTNANLKKIVKEASGHVEISTATKEKLRKLNDALDKIKSIHQSKKSYPSFVANTSLKLKLPELENFKMEEKNNTIECSRYAMTLSLDKKEFENTLKWLSSIANDMLLGRILGGVHLDISYKVQKQVLASHAFLDNYSDVTMFKEGLAAMFNLMNGRDSEDTVSE